MITPLDAHIRLANPRTQDTADDLIFRAGLNFSRGFDGGGQLDQGLAFVSFQRRMSQFLNTQARLAGEPLEEYIRPEGGGFYFAVPGRGAGGRDPGRAAVRLTRTWGGPEASPRSEIGRSLLDRLCAGRDESPAVQQVVDWLDSTKWSD